MRIWHVLQFCLLATLVVGVDLEKRRHAHHKASHKLRASTALVATEKSTETSQVKGHAAWCTDPVKVASNALTGSEAGGDRCAFYLTCVEADYTCGTTGDGAYPTNYGDKYCRKFLGTTFLTPDANSWRDTTLKNLHVALVPALLGGASAPATSPACPAIADLGFNSHPAAYTQPDPPGNLCKVLPKSMDGIRDLFTILGTVDGSDLMSRKSAKQVADVIGKCVSQISTSLGSKISKLVAFNSDGSEAQLAMVTPTIDELTTFTNEATGVSPTANV